MKKHILFFIFILLVLIIPNIAKCQDRGKETPAKFKK